MIGQASLLAPDATLPLRKRVEVHIAPLADVRMMLERWHYLHRVRTGQYGMRKLAKMFNVQKGTIGFILKGKTWAHVK